MTTSRFRARCRASYAPLLLCSLLGPSIARAQASAAEEPDSATPAEQAPPTGEAPKADAKTPKKPPAPKADEQAPAKPPPAKPEPVADAEDATDDAELAAAEAEMADEEAASAAVLSKPPAKGQGAIVGVVKDTKFSEAMIEASVEIVGNKKKKSYTDVEGRFRLELPPGTYSIRVTYELHRPSRVDQITIKAGQVVRVDLALTPDESAVEEVVIEEEVDKTSAEGQTLERKRSATVSDGVGRAEIARTPDRNAAEAAQRVVGATIVGGRFVFVRGLGERYTNALLNGTPLPSPEPDRQTVPLDLFPSLVLDSLTITKQFTPDMPADFAGGSVRIFTREFPRQTLFQISLSGGFNTEATFQDRVAYRGSKTDWLGYDGGVRHLPVGLPSDRRLDGSNATDAEREYWGERLNTYMSTIREGTPPNHGISVVAGDAFKVGAEQKVGALLALTYGRNYQIRDVELRTYSAESVEGDEAGVRINDDYTGEHGIDTVRWGTFGSLSFEAARDHRLNLTVFRSQSSDNSTVDLEGFREGSASVFHTTHMEFVSRALNFGQLRGTHLFSALNGLEIDWHAAIAGATRDQPDTRDNRYARSDGALPGWQFVSDGSGLHSFIDQSESTLSGGLDLMQPIIKSKEAQTSVKVGALLTTRDREFLARRFQLLPNRNVSQRVLDAQFCAVEAWNQDCPNLLFRPALIGPDGLLLEERTLDLDQYEASLDVYAGYAMVDAQVMPQLRLVGGARVEATDQRFVGFDPFNRETTEVRAQTQSTDLLPAFSAIFSGSSKANTRFGLTRTLGRPQLRELSPAIVPNYSGELAVQGNPDLLMTKITNADLRYEFFPTLREVLAFSFFYKHFNDPVEEIIAVGSSTVTYANADAANLVGLELEARKTLAFLAPALKDFTVIGNLTLVRSEVKLGTQGGAATNAERPLSYQSPYIVNFSVDYGNTRSGTDVRLLYNVSGPRITTVGSNGLPDTYELERHLVDLTAAQKLAKHFEIKLQIQNLLNAPIVFAMRNRSAYKNTVVDGVGTLGKVEGDAITRRYNPGATFTLSGTYTY